MTISFKCLIMQVILLGVGLQSTALYMMSSLGILPRADYAIFCDLGREGISTYQYLDYLQNWRLENNGVPILIQKDKNLHHDLITPTIATHFVSLPAFIKNPDGSIGMLKRQCTGEYKVASSDLVIRDRIYHLQKGSRRPVTQLWFGISMDEMERMSIPWESWKINVYPYIGYCVNSKGIVSNLKWGTKMSRAALESWYRERNLPIPMKSGYVFCPYQSDLMWAWRKEYFPNDFQAAVEVDHAIRDSRLKGIQNQVFLHRSCRPLNEVQFNKQIKMDFGECSGHCHT